MRFSKAYPSVRRELKDEVTAHKKSNCMRIGGRKGGREGGPVGYVLNIGMGTDCRRLSGSQ